MGKVFRSVALWLLGSLFVPALLVLFKEGAEAVGWDVMTGNALKGAAEWLVWFVGSDLYRYLVIGGVALALGIFLDWIARQFDASQNRRVVALGNELNAIRYRLQRVADRQRRYDELDTRALTMISTEFLALKVSLSKLGVRTPDRNWKHPEDPSPYMLETLGYIALVAPLLKRGHLDEVREIGRNLSSISLPSSDAPAMDDGW